MNDFAVSAARRGRWARLTVIVVAGLLALTAPAWVATHPRWEVISSGFYRAEPATLPPEGVHLFDSESALQAWLAPFAVKVSRTDPQYLYIPNVDFTKEMVAVIVASGGPWGVSSVTRIGGRAHVTLTAYKDVPYEVGALQTGWQVRRIIYLRLPKVSTMDVTTRWLPKPSRS